MRRYRKIHQQMVVRIIIAVTITITIISALSYHTIRSIIQEHVQITMQSNAEALVNEIEAIVNLQKSMLNTYSSFLKQAYINAETEAIIEQVTREFAKQNNPLVSGYWYLSQSNYDNKGEIFTWYGMNEEEEVINFDERYQADTIYSDNLNNPEYDYFYGAVQEGGMHISNPYMGQFVNIPMLSISTPLYDENDHLMGVAGIDIRFQDMQEYVSVLQQDITAGSMLLLSNQGQLLYKESSPEIDKLFEKLNEQELNEMLQSEKSSRESTDYIYDKQHELFYFTLPIQDTEWTSLLVLPVSELSNLLWNLMAVLAVTIVVFIIVVYICVKIWVKRLITKPMKQLMDMSVRISQGDYTQSIQIHMVNEWKLLAEHMNEMQDHLQHQAKLEQEMKRINSLKVVGEMAAAISHEIRNPLTTVRGFLHLMRNKSENEKEYIYYDTMIEEILRANTIITEYLALAQNKYSEFKPQSLNDIIEQLFPLVQATASVNGQYILLNLKPLPLIALDHNEIRQLLHNLIRNGLEAMEVNQLLRVRTFTDDKKAVIEVQDEGPGFDPLVLQHAGTPFITSKEEGTGLGLAICYSIIQRHQGSIDILSTSAGSTVRVEFPVKE